MNIERPTSNFELEKGNADETSALDPENSSIKGLKKTPMLLKTPQPTA